MAETLLEPPREEDSLAGGTIIGERFIVRRKLGGGGMGEVYLAENINVDNKYYAIKILRPEYSGKPRFVDMLHDEAAKQAKLDHVNVVGMYDYFRWAGRYCLVQAYIKGATLSQMLDAQPGGLDLDVALDMMVGVLHGLDFAHEAGILHCDVKPANVIVDLHGRPCVTDFGISRDIDGKSDNTGLGGAGTAEYMSPEQTLPPYRIDHRSDVFSAGVMFFEILCKHLPFDGFGSQDIYPQRTHDAPDVRQFRADIPEAIARIVATALQRDPDLRFQSCAAFAQSILDYRRSVEIRRMLRWAIPLALVLLVALGAGLYEWRQYTSRQAEIREAAAAQAQARSDKSNEAAIQQSVHNAGAALDQLCQISAEYEIKKAGVETARQSGLEDIARKFTDKLASMQVSIRNQSAAYQDAVAKLSSQDARVVAQDIEQGKRSDVLVKVFAPAIAEDDAALRAGRPLPALEQMQKRCPATASPS